MIPDTALRAITIPQLELILDHMRQRLAASTRMHVEGIFFQDEVPGALFYPPRYEGAKERIITPMNPHESSGFLRKSMSCSANSSPAAA